VLKNLGEKILGGGENKRARILATGECLMTGEFK
jgi:hypothetical protein